MPTPTMKEDWRTEIKRIMGDKYYEGVGTDFTAENIIQLFDNVLASLTLERKTGWYGGCGYCPDCANEEHECICDGWNQAVDELEKKKEEL